MVQNGEEYQSVSEFYAGKTIFITGGTGFLGKVLIEKILYSCPEICKIYMLIREKKHMSPYERIEQMTNSVIFTRLREKRPDDLKKIIPVVGDVTAPNLGIRADDEDKLVEEVSVVFHSAATVRFQEPLKAAMNINVEGTQKVLNLCRRMKNIKALVHVSTCFTNTEKKIVEEVVYPPPAQLADVYDFIKLYGDHETETKKILNGKPNTYTFTKALAETYVKENHGDIPTAIVRPAIVTPARNEPLKGWVDNWYGATVLLHYIAKGFCRSFFTGHDNVIDLIPVDYVSNLILVAAAKCCRSEGVTVFNSCTSSAHPILTTRAIRLYLKASIQNNFNDVPFPWVVMTRRRWLVNLIMMVTLTIPAYIADIWLFLRGKPAKFVKIHSQLAAVRTAVDYFTSNSWVMKSTGTQALCASLTPADRELYPFDVTDIDWDQYMYTYFMGVKNYLVSKKYK